jgi:hypothetical protein
MQVKGLETKYGSHFIGQPLLGEKLTPAQIVNASLA